MFITHFQEPTKNNNNYDSGRQNRNRDKIKQLYSLDDTAEFFSIPQRFQFCFEKS